MLSKEELVEFLALLLAFSTTNRLSANSMATVLLVSVPTMSRWLAAARAIDKTVPKRSTFHHIADPIKEAIVRLNDLNKSRGVYEAIRELPTPERMMALRNTLDGKNLW